MTSFSEWLIAPFVSPERHRFHRQCAWIQDECGEYMQQVAAIVRDIPPNIRYQWLGEAPDSVNSLPISHYQKCLGAEYEIIIYNASSEFNPNALLAVVGTITWGGRLVLLTPLASVWPTYEASIGSAHQSFGYRNSSSRYLQLFSERLATCEQFAVVANTGSQWPLLEFPHSESSKMLSIQARGVFANDEQANTYKQIKKAYADNHSCLLTGARGRGKSTLLGMLVVSWLAEGKDIDLISLHRESVDRLISYCLQSGEVKQTARAKWQHTLSKAHLRWMAPDNPDLELNTQVPLLVDEAAALPLPVLKRVIHPRGWFILTSTTLGYEGSGRGLSLRMNSLLASLGKQAPLAYALQTPVRWHPHDSLEGQISDLCFLKHKEHTSPQPDGFHFHTAETIDGTRALDALRLLDEAHYQSNPNDLKRLLDAPDVNWLLYYEKQQLAGAILVIREGGMPLDAIKSEIAHGTRRVRGHMSAQMLSYHERNERLATLTYWRIHRIAVVEAWRRKGIARKMLDELFHLASRGGVQGLSTVYGETPDLAAFWQSQGFQLVRVGKKQNKASGTYSALRLRWLPNTK